MTKKKNKPDALTLISNCNFNKPLAVYKTEKEKTDLKRDYIITRSNYLKSVNLVFDQNDPIVSELVSELKKLEKKIKKGQIQTISLVTACRNNQYPISNYMKSSNSHGKGPYKLPVSWYTS